MGARYVHITEEEFDRFAHSKRFTRIDEPKANEIVYARVAKHGFARMLIYSTISTMGGGGRKVGSDAIRLVLQVLRDDEWGGIGYKSKRVHRTKNWRNNLTDRMQTAADMIHKAPCPECGHAMIKRTGKHGDFYSCVMWPKTRCGGSMDG